MAQPTASDLLNRITQPENQLKTAQAKSTDPTDIDVTLAALRQRGGQLEFAEPAAQAQLITELIDLAKAKGLTLSPADAQLLLTGQQVLKALGYVAFSEAAAAPSSPAAVASAAQALQAQQAAKGTPISASEAVRRIHAQRRQTTRPAYVPPLKPWRMGGPSIVDLVSPPWNPGA